LTAIKVKAVLAVEIKLN